MPCSLADCYQHFAGTCCLLPNMSSNQPLSVLGPSPLLPSPSLHFSSFLVCLFLPTLYPVVPSESACVLGASPFLHPIHLDYPFPHPLLFFFIPLIETAPQRPPFPCCVSPTSLYLVLVHSAIFLPILKTIFIGQIFFFLISVLVTLVQYFLSLYPYYIFPFLLCFSALKVVTASSLSQTYL